jgi:RNA polymerase sigma-70 factor (ECF subfamily)
VVDLFLACACLRGDAVALAEFDREVLGALGPTLARLCRGGGADEVKQVLRQRLLLGEGGGRARIGDYSGRGPLRHWVAAAAARVALNLRRGRGAEASEGDEALAELPAEGEDAELAYIKAAHRREFVAAFQASLQSLTGRERTLLRLSFLDGLSIDEIGAMYRVHRSTVARWIARCREELLTETRRRLQEKLQLSPSELRSLMGVVDSHIDVSLSRFLGQ